MAGTFKVWELPKGNKFTHEIKAYNSRGKVVLHVSTRGHATKMEIEALEFRGYVRL